MTPMIWPAVFRSTLAPAGIAICAAAHMFSMTSVSAQLLVLFSVWSASRPTWNAETPTKNFELADDAT